MYDDDDGGDDGCDAYDDCDDACQLCRQVGLLSYVQGVFLHWASPKKLMYEKPRLGESTLT